MHAGLRAAAAVFLSQALLSGCRTGAKPAPAVIVAQAVPVAPATLPVATTQQQPDLPLVSPAALAAVSEPTAEPVQQTAHAQPVAEEVARPAPEVLVVEALVAEVLAVNPDIGAASAAWQAAAQRYPQEVALDDPMFGYMLGPGSWGSNQVEDAYTLEASQKLPWPGKRRLRGNIARAEANAAYYDVGEERLRIAELTRLAYYEYFLAHRQLSVVDESTRLLEDFRQIALARYEAATVEQQDVLLADVELADLKRRRLELVRNEQVARARINTLLLVPADAPLPPPPDQLPVDEDLPEASELRILALGQRPELAAQAARIRAQRHALALACKEFYPDFEVVARYDAFWQEEPLRPMVGMNLNVPVYRRKRWAAVREARARILQEQAELDALVNEINFDVERAYRRVEESRAALSVYQTSILPSVRHSVEAARASYVAGRLDFLRLVESQRQLLNMQERYYETVAEYHKRLTELQRRIGQSPYLVQSPPSEGSEQTAE